MNDIINGMVLGLCFILFFILFKLLVLQIKDIIKNRESHSNLKLLTAETLCKGNHRWDKMKLVMGDLPVDVYNICTECSFVSGTKYQLNKAATEIYINSLRIRKEQKERLDKLMFKRQELIDKSMNDLVKREVVNFEGDLQKNIEILRQFFRKSIIELDSVYAQLNDDMDKPFNG